MKLKQTHYLVFRTGEILISKLLKKGFGHVHILINDGINWLHINPSHGCLETEILGLEADKSPFSELDYFRDCVAIKMHSVNGFNKWIGRLCFMSCVLFAKYTIGLKKFSIITPFQLYKYILKMKLGEQIYGRTI